MTLYLFPNFLGSFEAEQLFPPAMVEAAGQIQGLIAESEKGGRSFLTRVADKAVPIALLREDPNFLLEPLEAGETWGLVSDAGMPCLADPGAKIVAAARRKGIAVHSFSGPSSIMLALVLSGLGGQRFAFHGYLAREREPMIRDLEERAKRDRAVQMFIEAPYRNQETLEALLATLAPTTKLGLAINLTCQNESVLVKPVAEWKSIDIAKQPTVFLISAEGRASQGRKNVRRGRSSRPK